MYPGLSLVGKLSHKADVVVDSVQIVDLIQILRERVERKAFWEAISKQGYLWQYLYSFLHLPFHILFGERGVATFAHNKAFKPFCPLCYASAYICSISKNHKKR